MKTPPIPANEAERLAALHRYGLLDSRADRTFDDLTWLAAHICQTPIALISLVDLDRQCFAARIGLDVAHTSREVSFCAHAILQSDLLVVPDALADDRFADNPLVSGDPNIRFYAGAPLLTPDGHALGTICTIDRVPRNLTPEQTDALRALSRLVISRMEQRLALVKAREAEQRRARKTAAIEAADEGIAILNERGEYTYLNAAHVKMFGYERADELLGRTWQQLYRAEEFTRLNEAVFPNLQRDGSWRGETIARRRDGATFAEEISLTVLPDGGLICVCRDITERKQEEEFHRQAKAATDNANAELARANRLKDEFLANMSHELRTPLNAVLGMSEALQEKILGPLNEKQAKSLQVIHESGAHLLSLINDILDLSKIEAGRMDLQREPVGVDSVCLASLRLVREIAHRKHLNPEFKKADAVRFVFGDERRIKQILVNLLTNAVKFTPAGGAVGLEVAPTADGAAVEFVVWDKGIGIAEADLAKLFKPFVQLDSGLARQHEGTGLGLALVWKLAELHGGSVRVESKPGHGSRFIVSLPAHNAETSPETAAPAFAPANTPPVANAGDAHPTVLLAEDNDANVLTFTTYLEGRGYRVAHARNGLEAVAHAKSYRPDVILMDMQMPVMDGLEATRRLRADAELKHTPIIALTALAMPGDHDRCLAAGADDYLAKPVNMKLLVQKIQEHLKRRR